MKSFRIQNTEKNWKWCYHNLMPEDYEAQGNEIVIFYRLESHRSEIITAITLFN